MKMKNIKYQKHSEDKRERVVQNYNFLHLKNQTSNNHQDLWKTKTKETKKPI